MRKAVLVSLIALVAVSVPASLAAPTAGLDRSFGHGGVVEVGLNPPAPDQFQLVMETAAARDGSTYVLVRRISCAGQEACVQRINLLRYLDNGSLDRSFGGQAGVYQVPKLGMGTSMLAVDSAGRPLLAGRTEAGAIVSRVNSSGRPDPSFGRRGKAVVTCRCGDSDLEMIPGRRGAVTIAFQRSAYDKSSTGPYPDPSGTLVSLVRLKSDGSVDRGLGHQGLASFALPGLGSAEILEAGTSGEIYLGGQACCGDGHNQYVVRVSRRGRLDARYASTAERSIRALGRWKSRSPSPSLKALVPRPDGSLDLLGSSGYRKGFEMRLRANGRLALGFAHRGLTVLPRPVAAAALGSGGAIFAVSEETLDSRRNFAFRLLSSGRLDPAFMHGIPIPGAKGDHGFTVFAQSGGRALVIDMAQQECRGECVGTPKLVRFLEGSSKKRR